MQVKIHYTQAGGVIHDLPAMQGFVPQMIGLFRVERIVLLVDVIIDSQQKTAGARGRIADSVPSAGRITSTMAWISGRGVKYWPAPDLVSWAFFSSRPS